MRAGIIIPVHNRRETTLACLERLRTHGVFNWATVIVVDDGSTDGTSEATAASFPEVRLITGDGTLYWTGATELGMRTAMAAGAAHVFWLNDDCEPEPGALAKLRDESQRQNAITGGVCLLPRGDFAVYAGFQKGRRELEFVSCGPNEQLPCDALNGNLVCIPREVVEAIGFPDSKGLPHAFGDTDYTLRAKAAGWPVLLVGPARARAEPHISSNYASWLVGDISVGELWRSLFRKKSYAYFPAHFRFLRRHWGMMGTAQCVWLVAKRIPISILMLVVPRSLRRRWWGHRSRAWQYELQVRQNSPRHG